MVEVSSWKACVSALLIAAVTHYVYQRLYSLPLKMEGYSDRNFRDVAQAFRYLIQSEEERGGAFVVYHRGHKVVDMLGGYADVEAEVPWTRDTITQLFSLSAVTAALSLFVLSHESNLSLADPVRRYWPEFADDSLTISQLLQHQHALYRLPEALSIRDPIDEADRVDALLASAFRPVDHSDSPGQLDTKFFVQGLYVDALVRRVDPRGRSVSQLFHEALAYPMSLDAHLGLPRTQYSRAARVQHRLADGFWAALWRIDAAQMWRALGRNGWWAMATEGVFTDFKLRWAMRADAMEVGHPSLGLFSNARSMARMMASVAGRGRLDDRQVLPGPAERFETLTEIAVRGYDRVLSGEVAYNGIGLQVVRSPLGSPMVGLYGYGGQMAFADPQLDLAFAYTTNHLRASSRDRDPTSRTLIEAIYRCGAVTEKSTP